MINLSLDFEACAKRKKLCLLMRDAYRDKPLIGALDVSIKCFFSMPQSWSWRKKQIMFDTPKVTKPDIDNVLKFILDAGNGILWEDDNKIVQVVICKRYAEKSRIEIEAKHSEARS
jgi:Holliday junction resolvase RusA-like endonuclease